MHDRARQGSKINIFLTTDQDIRIWFRRIALLFNRNAYKIHLNVIYGIMPAFKAPKHPNHPLPLTNINTMEVLGFVATELSNL